VPTFMVEMLVFSRDSRRGHVHPAGRARSRRGVATFFGLSFGDQILLRLTATGVAAPA